VDQHVGGVVAVCEGYGDGLGDSSRNDDVVGLLLDDVEGSVGVGAAIAVSNAIKVLGQRGASVLGVDNAVPVAVLRRQSGKASELVGDVSDQLGGDDAGIDVGAVARCRRNERQRQRRQRQQGNDRRS
jgi:hypothetical protein